MVYTTKRRKNMEHEVAKTSLYLPKEKYGELKEYCARNGMTVNGLVRVLIERHLARNGDKGGTEHGRTQDVR